MAKIIDQFGLKRYQKRSVIVWATNFYKVLFKNIFFEVNIIHEAVKSTRLHTYDMSCNFFFKGIVAKIANISNLCSLCLEIGNSSMRSVQVIKKDPTGHQN